MSTPDRAETLRRAWATESRWSGIERRYSAEDVVRVAGSVVVEHTLARMGAERLWEMLQQDAPTAALGTLTGNQAVQAARAGLKAIYCSGWQVAADANVAGQMYPDQSLYPVNSVPALVERINNAFARLDQIESLEGRGSAHWFLPIVADMEAGFGGPLNVFELMKAMIKA
ncbi:MAG: isocitrate lyase, partial [Candidatus Eremiobacteraeota bacterium]|nr:isocitrate lyase [Candidatus Eremiobacteraeota bacterium]